MPSVQIVFPARHQQEEEHVLLELLLIHVVQEQV